MRKRRFFSRTLAECIEPICRPALNREGAAMAKIIRNWETIIGPEIARHATPRRITQRGDGGGTLVVRTHGAFALEIQHMEPVILERLASYLGFRVASRIKIEQAGAQQPAGPKQRASAEHMRQALRQLAESLQSDGD